MTRIPLPAGGNKSENLNDRLEMSTAEIGLSVRTTNCLEERGIFTVNDLLNCSPEDLLDISNVGEKIEEPRGGYPVRGDRGRRRGHRGLAD